MGSEYFINNQELENKVRQLLPSQGGAGAGFDLSASTQIIPIIDLTESAEGSNLRQDLQTAFSHTTTTSFNVSNATTTIINNTGYWRIFGSLTNAWAGNGTDTPNFTISDGATDKIIFGDQFVGAGSSVIDPQYVVYDFNVFLEAGDSIKCISGNTNSTFIGSTRQIASIDGTLVNP